MAFALVRKHRRIVHMALEGVVSARQLLRVQTDRAED
jgi:hypothetical protein